MPTMTIAEHTIKHQAAEIKRLEAQLAEAHAALEVMVEQEVEYMEINNLGDPEQQQSIIMARKALTTDGKAAADVLAAVTAIRSAGMMITYIDPGKVELRFDAELWDRLVAASDAYRKEGQGDG